jgi:N-acetyl sugar amidotransferase
MKICLKCIQPDTRYGIYFKDGVCGACLWEDEKKTIDWDSRWNELQQIVKQTKENTKGNYDCVIGVSGGKDSTVQAITARDRLGLNCLLVNNEPAGITEIGQRNIENLKNLGFDVISTRSNPKILKKLMHYDFFNHLNFIKATEFPLYASTYIIAEKFNIPLIIQGENPGLTLGVRDSGVGTDSDALKVNELHTLSLGSEEYLNVEGVTKKDLFLYRYDKKKLLENGTRAIWLNYYMKEWSETRNAEVALKHGLEIRPDNFDPYEIGTYTPFSTLDVDLPPVNQMLKSIKLGFGACVDSACYDLREGRITKKEAIDLVLKYDGKCSKDSIKKLCEFIGISEKEFWNTVEKFRGPMWKKDSSGKWVNEYLEMLKK